MTVEESALYFDILPEDSIRNIVRFLSQFPRAEQWAIYMFLTRISKFLFVKGKLGKDMLAFCTALRVEREPLAVTSSLRLEPPEAIGCTPEELLDIFLPKSFRDSIWALDLRYKVPSEHLKSFSVKFPNITQLDLGFDDRPTSSRRDDISTSSRNEADSAAIADYWPNLTHLYLYDPGMYKWDEKAWENIGKKLRVLEVPKPLDIDTIDLMRKSCQNLKRLRLFGSDKAAREAITKWIVSCGNELEFVKLFMLEDEQLLRVKEACHKARFELITSESLLEQSVKTLGNAVEEVEMYVCDDAEEKAREQFDWSPCKNIKKSTFYFNSTVEDIQRFLKSPKNILKWLDIHMECGLQKIKAAISLIARNTGGLEVFLFHCKDAELGTFEELVAANRSLNLVRIYLINSAQENEVGTDIVKTFLKAPVIRTLRVRNKKTGKAMTWIPGIREICSKQGCRRVVVSAFGLLYLG